MFNTTNMVTRLYHYYYYYYIHVYKSQCWNSGTECNGNHCVCTSNFYEYRGIRGSFTRYFGHVIGLIINKNLRKWNTGSKKILYKR